MPIEGKANVSLEPDGRLLSRARLTEEDFREAAALLNAPVRRYRKTAQIAARPATEAQTVITFWNGEETKNVARPGDMLVTTLREDGSVERDLQGNANTYVIKPRRFAELYEATNASALEPEFGEIYEPKGQVEAFHAPNGFDIIAPWGEPEHADAGFILKAGSEVYGVVEELFLRTYALIDRPA